jgi:molybdate transport system substrate-binding protein
VLAVAAFAGCGQQPAAETPSGGSAEAAVIEVLVPCGQVGPFSEIVKRFEADNPAVRVEWVPENIVTIVNKLIDGKEQPDVFLSMGDLEMDQVEQAGLVMEGTRVQYAENALAIMVPADNPAGVQVFADLTKPAVKAITVPDPEQNSVGVHAMEAFENAGIWEGVKGKVLWARFAADSKDVAARGQAQASIGYYPCGVEVHVEGEEPAHPKKLRVVCQVPSNLYTRFYCEGAVLKGSQNSEGARALLAYLQRPESQETFRKWSFVCEEPEAPAG